MKSFFETNHCRSNVHCKTCRTNESWRQNISENFDVGPNGANFDCPFTQEERSNKNAIPTKALEKKRTEDNGKQQKTMSTPDQILDRKEDLNDKFSPLINSYKEQINRASCGRCARRRLRRKFIAQIEALLKPKK